MLILFQYRNNSDRIILPGKFRELDEVCSEVPEDSGLRSSEAAESKRRALENHFPEQICSIRIDDGNG